VTILTLLLVFAGFLSIVLYSFSKKSRFLHMSVVLFFFATAVACLQIALHHIN